MTIYEAKEKIRTLNNLTLKELEEFFTVCKEKCKTRTDMDGIVHLLAWKKIKLEISKIIARRNRLMLSS
jgi:hypothetical protein